MVLIALAGNPNCGKTTLFNALTGARQHVGNYPGVTVEHKRGLFDHKGTKIELEDLPGIYSLSAYSAEEEVARDFLLEESPEVVVNVVDSSNLERNLYLTVQLMEMKLPLCIALNMMDVAKDRGMEIDVDRMSELLGVPVIPTVARRGTGKEELIEKALTEHSPQGQQLKISYGPDVDQTLTDMEKALGESSTFKGSEHLRWMALKFMEGDESIKKKIEDSEPEIFETLTKLTTALEKHLRKTAETYPEAVIADHRYGYVKSLLHRGVITYRSSRDKLYVSDKLDMVFTNRFIGPIIMAIVLMIMYKVTFTYSEVPVGWFESFFGWLGEVADSSLPDGLLKSMIMSGVIDGVGGVMGFVPLIFLMFLGIAFLEDTGYLARVAFMLDRVFRVFGLHGSSVMPFIISGGIAGGCAVPGVMAARTIKSPKERLATLLTAPFMNCGAKLPVFALLVGAFFAEKEASMMLIITAISWIGALIAARILRSTILRGETTPFVMELPPYRFPTFQGLMIHTWERTWQYIKKAGTVILGISILLWAMMTFPGLNDQENARFDDMAKKARLESTSTQDLSDRLTIIDRKKAEENLRRSYAGRIGTSIEGVTSLAGLDWRDNIALIGGFAAKEVVISTMGTAYSLGEVDPEEARSLEEIITTSPNWSPLKALAFIIFTMFYAPCFVTVVMIVRETGSWKWGVFSVLFNTSIAFLLAVSVYQGGLLLGLGV